MISKCLLQLNPQKKPLNLDVFSLFSNNSNKRETKNDNDDFFSKKPLEELIQEKGKGEFKFDPENGGGRRRRIKKLSRIQMLDEEMEEDETPNTAVCVKFENFAQRPLGVNESLY